MSVARAIVSPPEVVVRLFGPRPAHRELRPAWDRAVTAIAGYRHGRDLADETHSALGPAPAGGSDRAAWQQAVQETERAAAALGRPLERALLLQRDTRGIEFET